MIRKLTQGIGRLCREDKTNDLNGKEINNWGVAIVLDGRFETTRVNIKKSFPSVYRNQFFYSTKDRLLSSVIKMTDHMNTYKSPYNEKGQLSLLEFL